MFTFIISEVQMSLVDRGAVELGKPAAGFISAILNPYIRKVESWANDKSLNSQLSSEALNQIFKNHIVDLSNRVCEITSIAFPQHQLSLFEAYEPLILVDHTDYRKRLETRDIVDLKGGSYVIRDGAGVGKSTFSKHLVSQILHKHDKIPILIELRNIPENVTLLDSLSSELDTISSKFPQDLFLKLAERGDFVMILDGFDEVRLERQASLAQEINSLSSKAIKNTLFITTRPQELIPSISQSSLLEFSEFSVEQCKSLLRRYDSYCSLSIGDELIKQLDMVPDKFLETPLLVSLLYRTYGVNNSIANSISTFYEEVYSALYKGHDLINKNGYSRQKKSGLDYEKFRVLLRSLCYYMLVQRRTSFQSWSQAIDFIDNARQLKSVDLTSSHYFLDDLLTSVPLMVKDGQDYKFLHKTIIEYFAAEYIIYNKNSSTIMDKIYNGKLSSGFEKVFDFIRDMDESLFHSIVTVRHAKQFLKIQKALDYDVSLQTSLYFHSLHIGFWELERYTDITKNDDKFRNFSKDVQVELFDSDRASCITWNVAIIDGKSYYIAVGENEKHVAYKNLFLQFISEPPSPKESTHLEADGSLFELIEPNKWIEIDDQFLMKSLKYPLIRAFILDALHIDPFCSVKCNKIIAQIENEEQMESSIDLLL